jgi:hypothetical protein
MNALAVMRTSASEELLRDASVERALWVPNRDCVYPTISSSRAHIIGHP